jgi:hydroxymethylbilane synthase
MSPASTSMPTDTPTAVIRLGTRRSALAMAQATTVAQALRAGGSDVELVGVTTDGDRSSTPLTQLGGVGVFVTQLREELLDGHVDVVVHSLKDLPTTPAPGLRIAAIPTREDPRDALVARGQLTLVTLPSGASVGTGSPRRAAQLRAIRPDLDIRPLRGNVDTRIGKVASGDLDAVVVAAAGLARLGRLDEATQLIGVDLMAPAPGQGALAIECRVADDEPGGRLHELLAAFDDRATRAAVTAERGLLAALEAGCTAPVGAFAEVGAALDLHLVAVVVSVDGVTTIRGSAEGPASDAEGIGRRLAADLLAEGAGMLMAR